MKEVKKELAVMEPTLDAYKLEKECKTLLEFTQFLESFKEGFPNLFDLVKIAITLPISSAMVERSFSVYKRILNYIRNSTGPDRMNWLSFIHIHKELIENLDIDKIVSLYCLTYPEFKLLL
jgi:hypothetical protein